MKELINFFYNIEVTSLEDNIVRENNNIYLINKINDFDKPRIDIVNNIINNVNFFSIFPYRIITNKFGSIYFYDQNNQYILVRIDSNYNSVVDFTYILDFYTRVEKINLGYKYNSHNWEGLWEQKINKLYNIYMNNKVNKKNISELFFYYIGIAEVSLQYLKKINSRFLDQDLRSSLCHYRIAYPLKNLDFYNPCNMIIDIKIRDIAEYIKSCYISDVDYCVELDFYLKTLNLSKYEASLFYSRILYPSFFIDMFMKDEKCDFSVLYDTKKYELFLKKTYELINSYVSIDNIPWITDPH